MERGSHLSGFQWDCIDFVLPGTMASHWVSPDSTQWCGFPSGTSLLHKVLSTEVSLTPRQKDSFGAKRERMSLLPSWCSWLEGPQLRLLRPSMSNRAFTETTLSILSFSFVFISLSYYF